MRRASCKLILMCLLVWPAVLHAQDSDVVELSSGNRMTGEVRGLSRGMLTFAIAGAGPVSINWSNVEAIRSKQRMDVELASGARLTGSIATVSSDRLQVATADGDREVTLGEVVRITPIRADFRARTNGSADIGFEFLRAGDNLDFTLNADAEHRTERYLTAATLSALVRRFDGTTTQRRNYFEIDTRRFRQNRWFVLGQFEAEENRELDLELRLLAGLALGRTLLQSQRTVLAAYAGVDYALEEYRNIPGTDTSPEALASLEWDWFELGGDTELALKATTYAGLDRSRVRFALDGSLRRYIVRSLYWSLNLYESYDSEPPPGREHSDFGLSLTFGSAF